MSATMVEFIDVTKAYGGLRPLRVKAFSLRAGERAAIVGLDGQAAEAFVNLLTGASLPDQGAVRLFGRETASVADADDWLRLLDRLGIVSVRAVLLDELTLAENVATAFTLSIDPMAAEVAAQVARVAAEAGLEASALARRVADASGGEAARCHLAKALALDPALLVLEHANAVAAEGAPAFGAAVRAAAQARGMAALVLTADEKFARAAADRILAIDAATGDLKDRTGWRRFF